MGPGTGDAVVAVAEGFGAHLRLDTGSGHVAVDLPLREELRSDGRLSGVIGAGGGHLQVETGSGDVRIRRR